MEYAYTDQATNRATNRKVLIWLACSVAGFFLLLWLYHYLNTGQVIVTTNSPYNSISLIAFKNGQIQNGAKSYKARGKLSDKVSAGHYVVSVDGGSIATYQPITLKGRQVLHININPASASAVEPVAYENTQSLAIDNQQLEYLNPDGNLLYRIGPQNIITPLGYSLQLKTVHWADPSFGVGQDDAKHLFTISNGVVAPLKVPFTYGNSVVNFGVSPSKQIYVSNGPDVFKGDRAGNFKKIYTAKSMGPVLAIGTADLAVISRSDSGSTVITINGSGNVVATKNIDAVAVVWAPDDHSLVALSDSQGANIYTASLHKVSSIPNPGGSLISNAIWLNDNTLSFSIADQLWTYDAITHKAQILANMPLANYIEGVYLNSDKSYIYMTTVDPNTGTGFAIRRVGLKGQVVPGIVSQLQDILPLDTGDGYSLGLINFAAVPVIKVVMAPDGPANAQQLATQELQSDGIDVSKLQFQVIQQQ